MVQGTLAGMFLQVHPISVNPHGMPMSERILRTL